MEAVALTHERLHKKVIGVPLLERSIQEQEDGSIIVRGYFTTDEPDVLGDIITREATEKAIPAYRQWGNIRYMHMPRPVAKVLRIGVDDDLDWNEVEIQVIDPQAVFEVKNGLLKALSVGILVDIDSLEFTDDGGWIVREYILAEISLVDHPANYGAKLQLSLEGNDPLRRLIRAFGYDALVKELGPMEEELKDVTGSGGLGTMETDVENVAGAEDTSADVSATPPETDVGEAATAEDTQDEEVTEPEAAADEAVGPADEQPVEAEEAPAEDVSEVSDPADVAVDPAVFADITQRLEHLERQLEAVSEALLAAEQDAGEGDATDADLERTVDALKRRVDTLEKQLKFFATPASRKAVIAKEPLPHEEVPETEENVRPVRGEAALRAAVERLMAGK